MTTYEAGNLITTTVDGQTFLVDPESTQTYRLNRTASTVFALLCDGLLVSDVARTIAEDTGADLDAVTADVETTTSELVEVGAVAPRHSST